MSDLQLPGIVPDVPSELAELAEQIDGLIFDATDAAFERAARLIESKAAGIEALAAFDSHIPQLLRIYAAQIREFKFQCEPSPQNGEDTIQQGENHT